MLEWRHDARSYRQYIGDRMETLQELISKIESYNFECEAGPLSMCVDWMKLKAMLAASKDAK